LIITINLKTQSNKKGDNFSVITLYNYSEI